jgi:hypothetical protein
VPPRDPYGRGDLVARSRETHCFGPPNGDTGVSRVQRELEGLGTRTVLADGGSEVGDELVVGRIEVRDTRDATD